MLCVWLLNLDLFENVNEYQPLAIKHLMITEYNTSTRSGTAVTTERVHGYNNSHNVKAYRGNIQHTLDMLNIHAYKKTKIAIYDEKHSKHHNCSQWHQVTVHDHRNSIIELLTHSKSLNKIRVGAKTNRSNQVQPGICNQYNSKADKKKRYKLFLKNYNNDSEDENQEDEIEYDNEDEIEDENQEENQNHNVTSHYHRKPAEIINEQLTVFVHSSNR